MFDMYVKTPMVFFHFLCAAYALVNIIALDVRTLRSLHKPLTQSYINHAKSSQVMVGLFLSLLYVTGFAFVILGAKADGGFLANENLYFKIGVVCILTLNAFLGHFFLRELDTGDVIDRKSWIYGFGLRVVPAISINSWLWAAFSGVARSWNFNVPIEHIFGLYGITTGTTIAAVLVLNGQWGSYGKKAEAAKEGSTRSLGDFEI